MEKAKHWFSATLKYHPERGNGLKYRESIATVGVDDRGEMLDYKERGHKFQYWVEDLVRTGKAVGGGSLQVKIDCYLGEFVPESAKSSEAGG